MSQFKQSFSALVILILLFVFSYSFFSKALNFNQFSADILASPLISERMGILVKILVPFIEVVIVGLILSRYRVAGYYLAFFSLTIFTTYYVLFYKVAKSACGCGKLFDSLGFYPHLMLNMVLLTGCVYLIYNPFLVTLSK